MSTLETVILSSIMAVLFSICGYAIYSTIEARRECDAKNGVYLSRVALCVHKDSVIK